MTGEDAAYPIVIRRESSSLIFLFVVSAISAVIGVAIVIYPDAGSGALEYVIGTLTAIAGAVAAWVVLRSRIALWPDRLEIFNGLWTRTVTRADIQGFRIQSERSHGIYLELVNGRRIALGRHIQTDPAFRNWSGGLPDLDAEDLRQSEEALDNDPALGATVEERRAVLKQKTRLAGIVTTLAVIVAAAMAFWHHPPLWLAAATLAISPAAVAFSILVDSTYSILAKGGDARPSLFFVCLTPIVAATIRTMLDISVLDPPALMKLVLVTGVALAAALALLAPEMRTNRRSWAYLLLATITYAYAAIMQADTQIDTSKPAIYRTLVQGKHKTSGKSTSYYLNVDAWGPESTAGDMEVSWDFYNAVNPGDRICITLRAGRLGIAWYYPGFC